MKVFGILKANFYMPNHNWKLLIPTRLLNWTSYHKSATLPYSRRLALMTAYWSSWPQVLPLQPERFSRPIAPTSRPQWSERSILRLPNLKF